MRTPLSALLLVLLCPVVVSCGGGELLGFDWLVTPDRRTVQPGQTATFRIKIKNKFNINADVELRVTGAPADATTTLDPPVIPDTSDEATLRIATTPTTPLATYQLRVYAKEAGQTEREVSRLLIVAAAGGQPDFSLLVDPLYVLFRNPSAGPTITFYVRPLNGFLGTVTIEILNLGENYLIVAGPEPPTLTFTDSGGKGGTFVLQPNAPPNPPEFTYAKVRATSGAIVHEQTIVLEFLPS